MDDFKRPLGQQPSGPTSPLQPCESDPMPPASEPMKVKKKGGAKKWLLWGIVVLLLASLAAFGYWQWTEAENAKKEAESAKQELATVKAVSGSSEVDPSTSTTSDTEPTDEDAITTESEAYIAARVETQYVIEDDGVEVEGMYAVVTALIPNSDADVLTIVLEKSKGVWVVIYGETGDMSAADRSRLVDGFDVPSSLLP